MTDVSDITLNLVVLRCSDLERAIAFYTKLGLKFTSHRHGKGPEHFAAEFPGGVFELYPRSADGGSTNGTRIGFRVSQFPELWFPQRSSRSGACVRSLLTRTVTALNFSKREGYR
jgi:catechol 2,3-dioxygenase-like lactoylglutathione lyase family enzyme